MDWCSAITYNMDNTERLTWQFEVEYLLMCSHNIYKRISLR